MAIPEQQGADERMIKLLSDLGASPELIADAASGGNLARIAGDLALARGSDMTVAELAVAAGVDEEKATAIWRELGIQPEPNDPRFGARDAEAIALLVRGADLEVHGTELLRVLGASLARVADAAVSLYVQNVEDSPGQDGLGEFEKADELTRTLEFMLSIGDSVPGVVLSQHLREAISRQRTTQQGVSNRIVARMAVGFVDLVGSTQLANRLSSREFLDRVAAFEARAFDVAIDRGGRIVKHVGDEVMFMALTADVACKVALSMTNEFTATGVQPRGGIAFGEVITYHGDYYGPVVNLASRLADHAVPGEILVDTAVRESSLDPSVVFEPAGRRVLKGFEEPVPVFSLSSEDELVGFPREVKVATIGVEKPS